MNLLSKILTLSAVTFFAASLSAQSDTIITEHGYRCINHTKLSGPHPQSTDFATIQVRTWLGDSLMASTAAMGGPREIAIPSPETLPKRVPPIFDALLLMAKGDSVTLLQPIDSILRRQVPESLQKETLVRYEVVMVDFVSAEEKERRKQVQEAAMAERLKVVESQTQQLAKDYQKGKVKGKVQKTASGLQYIVHEPGTGAPLQKGENVSAHYYGCLPDGKKFDDSFSRGEPLPFTVGEGQMIPGFDEAVLLLRHGSKATLFIPYNLAYGEQGIADVIPPKTDLIFYVEIQ